MWREGGPVDDFGNVLLGHDLAGRVALHAHTSPHQTNRPPDIQPGAFCAYRVDDAERARRDAVRACLRRDLVEVGGGHRPVVALVEVVADLRAAQRRDRRGVQRVLRDRDHDAVVRAADQHVQQRLDALRRAVREVEALDVGRVAVALLDVGLDRLAGRLDPLGVAVGAWAATRASE